jgi:hypothetical protein
MSLKFGTFMAPFHCPVGQDPTAAYERDLTIPNGGMFLVPGQAPR